MTYQFPTDIDQQVKDRLSTGRYHSEDDVLRAALTALGEADADLAAIEAAIDEWKSGDEGLPVDEAFAEIRRGQQQSSQV
ncbi:hypothetical protein GC176_20010 [bacterium]|nr:hypothetical protein [bacterium]